MTSDNLTTAQLWRSRGFAVLPIIPGVKKPALEWGEFTTDQTDERIMAHWSRHPDHLVAVRCDGLFVIDCDDEQSEANYQAMVAPIGPAPFCTMRTTRGHHYYYQLPADCPRVSMRGSSEPGYIDIKTGKSYVVVRDDHVYSDTRTCITTEQIQTVYALDGEVWPFPAAAPSQRTEWEGDPSKLMELQLLLKHIDAAELGYMDYLSVVAGVHQDFGGASDALDLLLDWSADPDETAYKWDTFTVGRPAGCVTLATVAKLAQARGADLSAISHKAQMMRVFGAPSQPQPAMPAPTPHATPMPAPAPVATYEPLRLRQPITIPSLTGDQTLDAIEIIKHAFAGRMARMDDEAVWWTGRNWEPVAQIDMLRHVSTAMCAGGPKSSHGRAEATAKLILIYLPAVTSPTADARVYYEDCVWDPVTGTTAPHSPLNGNRSTLATSRHAGLVPLTWLAWLRDIFDGEQERVDLLQELVGWCMVRHTLGIEKAAILIGPPRAGKGTVIRILKQLLGDMAPPFRFCALDNDKSLSSMRGCHVAIDSDASDPPRQDSRQVAGLFRTLTSNEPIQVKLLYRQTPWRGALGCKLMLAANSIPHMGDDSGATAARWLPLVFNKSFLDVEDAGLFDRLSRELPAIAAWGEAGLARLVARGRFVLPTSSRDVLDRATSSGSPITAFIDDMLVFGKDCRISDVQLYNAYAMWATSNAVEAMPKRYFIQAVCDACQGHNVRWAKSVNIDGKVLRGYYGVSIGNVVPIRSATM